MKQYQGTSKIGEFYLSSKTLAGQLKIDGEDSELNLHSKEFFHTDSIENGSIKGLLSDNKKVSLIDCITLSSGSIGIGGINEGQNYSTIFPHYVIFGDQYIDPSEAKILALNFVVEDASTLFYDFDAFGIVLTEDCDAKNFLQKLSDNRERGFEIGEYPEIFYYTGKRNIFNSETYLGKIYASYCPSLLMPSPNGIQMKNTIPIHIEFTTPLVFEEALRRFYILLNFIDIILGTPQHIEYLSINVESEKDYPEDLQVYCCMQPDYRNSLKSKKPHPSDILINGGMDPHEFSEVLSSWLARQENWQDSRSRFIQSFRHKNSYSIDRLIGAANMFDILPECAVGETSAPSEEVKCVADECKALFKNIGPCSEKDSILNALGRIGKHNLKTKVKNRAKLITAIIEDRLPELELIIDEAINCRNFYVHGTEGKLTPEIRNHFSTFFTDTLEFIFGVSDLIEAGWDIKKWVSRESCLSHPFAQYIHGYPMHLKEFKES